MTAKALWYSSSPPRRSPCWWRARRAAACAPCSRRNEDADIAMIAVIFEVWPAEGRKDDYLALAAALRDDLERIDGFVSVERFQSLTDPGKLLSLSVWRDEAAVQAWRTTVRHREAQRAGRGG